MARSTRRRLRQRLRARLLFAARFAAVVLLSTYFVASQEQRAAIAHALANPMDVLSGRSPGERQTAALRPTKVRHELTLPKGEKLLSEARTVDEGDLSGEPGFFAAHEPAPPPAETTLPKGTGPASTGDMPAVVGTGGRGGRQAFGGGMIGGSLVGGGGGGGGGGNPGCGDGAGCGEGSTVPVGDPVPPTIIGVPEPATWAMILIGFFTLGSIIRRTKAAGSPRRPASRQPGID